MHVSERVKRFVDHVRHLARLGVSVPPIDDGVIEWLKRFDEWDQTPIDEPVKVTKKPTAKKKPAKKR